MWQAPSAVNVRGKPTASSLSALNVFLFALKAVYGIEVGSFLLQPSIFETQQYTNSSPMKVHS